MEKATRRGFFVRAAVSAAAAHLGSTAAGAAAESTKPGPTARHTFGLLKQGKKIPVIFDTDIGNDIDDTWALTFLIKSPEFDVKLVVSDSGNDIYRARILAKMLQVCGRTDVPVGVGLGKDDKPGRQSAWVGRYRLDDYPGTVYEDGIEAMIRTIHGCQDPVTVIAVGPVPNIATALKKDPSIARRARFVGMHGSVRRGYGNSPKISAEYNVQANPTALQTVFAAPWDLTITPLDTCGIIHLTGRKYQKVARCPDPAVRALIANYLVWRQAMKPGKRLAPPDRSSTLFDTVAIYLGFSQALVEMEDVPLRVTDDGYTVIDKQARIVHCAMRWKDLGAFEDLLVQRLTGAV